MKKNIGKVNTLYPTPVTVVGVMKEGKPTWLTIAHVGIVRHDMVLISCGSSHDSDTFIKKEKVISLNLVDESLIKKADYVGSNSGKKIDKSQVFEWEKGEAGSPVIKNAPVTMECSVVDTYETAGFDNFILRIENTYADENILTSTGKIDYEKFKPILFSMQFMGYIKTGDLINKENMK